MYLYHQLIEKYHNSQLPDLFKKLRLTETCGIASALLMVVFSLFSYAKTDDGSMILNSALFLYLLIIRLILFFWNLAIEKKPFANTSQSIMMLVTAITLSLVNTTLAISIVRFISASLDHMNFPDHTVMSIIYGLYTFGKLA